MSSLEFDQWNDAGGNPVMRINAGELEVWDGSAWGPAGGLQYATVSDTPTGTFSDGGVNYQYWSFTANGSLTVTAEGLLDILVVGGGGGGAATPYLDAGGGGAGGVRFNLVEVTAGTHAVTIGAGGAGAYAGAGAGGVNGNSSSFATFSKIGGGGRGFALNGTGGSYTFIGGGGAPGGFSNDTNQSMTGTGAGGTLFGAADDDGITLNYSGTSVEYGVGGQAPSTTNPPANTGNGGYAQASSGGGTGASGIVIVRVRV